MKQLWAPWRMTYIRGESDVPETGCVFCLPPDPQEDERRLILHRGEHAFIIMNKYPYTNGHLMIAPYRHTADPATLDETEALEMHRFLVLAREVLQEVCAPQGFNIGMNLGQIAGAGVADHLHQHLVPRWSGDTNFMPVFSDVRIIPQHLEETYQLMRQAFARRRP
ncbi:MAG: HIT domain-containing protein [Desulfuromonadales bacterium]|nr:HIT domain-containing protein [Desulfuromonadales bacterium]